MRLSPAQTAHLQQLSKQLQFTCNQLDNARQARDQLIAQAHKAGLSLRKIAAAAGLSPTRVHQVLCAEAGRDDTAEPQNPALLTGYRLKKIFLFSGLDDTSLAALGQHAVLRSFAKNTILINEGDNSDSLYLILSGSVQVYTSDNEGKEALLATLAAGDCFGELSLLDGRARSASVRTLEPCQTLVLSREAFGICMYQHPSVAQELLRTLAGMVRYDNNRTKGLALMGVYERLASTLQELGQQRDGAIVVSGVTHQSLAERVYASREMVTLILKELKQGGYISVNKQQITINKRLPAKW